MAVAPMNAHFVWWDGNNLQETHINDILNNIDSIPQGIATGFLILVLRYVNRLKDGTTTEDFGGYKLGHFIAGHDHYYVNLRGNPVESVEYALWTGNTTGNTRVEVYELTGQNREIIRTDVRANTFPNNRVFDGVLVADSVYEQALSMASDF